jgi:hypothetical protein
MGHGEFWIASRFAFPGFGIDPAGEGNPQKVRLKGTKGKRLKCLKS